VNLEIQWKGLWDYSDFLKEQDRQHEKIRQGTGSEILWGCHHPAVITLGRRGSLTEDILDLENKIPVLSVDRGGQATLHSQGQLMIYPMVNWSARQIGPLEVVRQIHRITGEIAEECGQDILQDFDQVGVFTNQGKLAFTGLRIDRGISRHGHSINVSNDLSLFQKIRSCGIENAHLVHLQTDLSLEEIFEKWSQKFSEWLEFSG
jgi:lipoyl(octanoyl) transferase